MTTQTPYDTLTPELILNAIESIGYQCSGSLLALNSYENRVYQVGIDEASPIIAKFYRPHRWSDAAILEEHQFSLELAEHDIPIVGPLTAANGTLHTFEDFRFAVFERQGGRTIELDNPTHLEWIGRFLGRIHAVSDIKKFQHRIHLNVVSYGEKPYQFLIEHDFIPMEIKTNYVQLMDALLDKLHQLFDRLKFATQLRLHGDCHAGNILWNDRGPQIVDLDDCLTGPAVQDIWMLLGGNTEQERQFQLNTLLEGYEMFHEFDYRELHLIEGLRTLRMIHYSAWLAKRWNDPAFPLNFPWFNTRHYWEEQLQMLREQSHLVDEALMKVIY